MRVLVPLVLLMLAACGSDSLVTVAGPRDDSSPPPTSGTTIVNANWIGDATVTTASGSGGCGWGRTVGETRSGVLWRVVITGNTVTLDEDMANWPTDDLPYSGTLNGLQFTAQYTQTTPAGVCQFESATLIGTFSDDFSTFTADETVRWGAGFAQTIVQRRWQARKR
jgi:hypothetical protein